MRCDHRPLIQSRYGKASGSWRKKAALDEQRG
jgi:hypothetical protein